MRDDEDGDGGESMNAVYYGHLWTKPMKVRSAAKRVKHKRALKKAVFFGNVSVGAVKHLARLLNKRKDPRHTPLLRGKFA